MQTVIRTTRSTKTVCLFPYGGEWRISYTKISNSKADSKLLAFHNEKYGTIEEATKAYNQIKEAMK